MFKLNYNTEKGAAKFFTKHEFSVVPRSLFDSQGKLWRCNDKSDFFSGLADKSITLDFQISTLDSLAVQFGNKKRAETAKYGGVVLIFDRYDDSLRKLKNRLGSSSPEQRTVQSFRKHDH